MIVRVDSHIRVGAASLPGQLAGQLATMLTMENPAVDKAKKEMVWGWDQLPKSIELWDTDGMGGMVLPRGFARKFATLVPGQVEWEDNRTVTPIATGEWKVITPRGHYQAKAVDAMLLQEQGVYQAPPGAGKTVTVLEAIRRAKLRALVIVHNTHIAEQWRARCKEHLGFEPGLIGDGIWEERGNIDIALQQTIWSRKDELEESGWFDAFGFVCLDECHHVPANTFYYTVQRFSAKYRVGVSATPDKNWDLKFLVEAALGPVFHETTKQDLVDADVLVLPKVRVVDTDFGHAFWPTHSRRSDGTCGFKYCKASGQIHRNNYNEMMKALISNQHRNEVIARILREELSKGRTILCLSRRLEHLDALAKRVKGNVLELTGRQTREERMEIYELAGKGPCLILSTIGDEALDIPELDCVVLAYPTRNQSLVRQQVGRVERVLPGKRTPLVIDFRDDVGVLRSQLNDRLGLYGTEGYEIVYDDYDSAGRKERPHARATQNR